MCTQTQRDLQTQITIEFHCCVRIMVTIHKHAARNALSDKQDKLLFSIESMLYAVCLTHLPVDMLSAEGGTPCHRPAR